MFLRRDQKFYPTACARGLHPSPSRFRGISELVGDLKAISDRVQHVSREISIGWPLLSRWGSCHSASLDTCAAWVQSSFVPRTFQVPSQVKMRLSKRCLMLSRKQRRTCTAFALETWTRDRDITPIHRALLRLFLLLLVIFSANNIHLSS